MKKLLLTKVRLSWYFCFFAVLYFVLLGVLPRLKFESSVLTLFSVNSFLYGFYITPILSGQKSRIDELHKIVRAEANAIFTMALTTKKMPKNIRNKVQKEFDEYIQACSKHKLKQAEKEYEDLITFCLSYSGKHAEEVEKLLGQLVANQQNRTNFYLQMGNRVYSNEWMIMAVLFSITLSFVLLIDTGTMLSVRIVTALLCTGISMLMLNLIKLNSLSHKKAKQIWAPFNTLLETRYYRTDDQIDEE